MSFFRSPQPKPRPVQQEDLDDFLKRALPIVRSEAKREKRFGNAKSAAILLLMGGLVFTVSEVRGLTQAVIDASNRVIYSVGRDDGTLVNSEMYRALPARFQTDNTLNTLWHYVFWQECYSEATRVQANFNVQQMSDERVQNEWLAFFGRRNPESPQNTLGARGAYHECKPTSYMPLDAEGTRYGFRFVRTEIDNKGNRGREMNMWSTVTFRTGVYSTKPDAWIARVTYNAPGVQVTEYDRAKLENPRTPMVNAARPAAARGEPPR